MGQFYGKDHLPENVEKNTSVQQNWRVTCLKGNRRGKQGPHLDDIISFATEFGFHCLDNGQLLTGVQVT